MVLVDRALNPNSHRAIVLILTASPPIQRCKECYLNGLTRSQPTVKKSHRLGGRSPPRSAGGEVRMSESRRPLRTTNQPSSFI